MARKRVGTGQPCCKPMELVAQLGDWGEEGNTYVSSNPRAAPTLPSPPHPSDPVSYRDTQAGERGGKGPGGRGGQACLCGNVTRHGHAWSPPPEDVRWCVGTPCGNRGGAGLSGPAPEGGPISVRRPSSGPNVTQHYTGYPERQLPLPLLPTP